MFVGVFLYKEFSDRKKRGLSPTSVKSLLDMGAKWKRGSNPHISALLFASSAFVCFGLWESLIWSALSLYGFTKASLVLGMLLAGYLLNKRKDFHPWTFEESILAQGSLALLSGALFCWVLFPWVYFRSLFLKKS